MCHAGLTLTAFLAIAPAAFAQAPTLPGQPPADRVPIPGSGQPAPAPAGVDPTIRALLVGWQTRMQGVNNFYAKAPVTRTNMVQKKTTNLTGSIYCLKPNLAYLRLDWKPAAGQKPDPNDYQAYICSGKAVYVYDGTLKTVTEHPLPNGGVGNNLLLEFISGALSAEAIINRFDLKLVSEEQYYIHLEIRPRMAHDKKEFESVLLVLYKPTAPPQLAYLPRIVVIRSQNGQEEERWDFPDPQVNAQGIKPEFFQPVMPKDWKFERKPPMGTTPPGQPQPRVVRPGTP